MVDGLVKQPPDPMNQNAEDESDQGQSIASLRQELEDARARVAALEAAYSAALSGCPHLGDHGANGRPVRIFLDGAFDLTHFGHMNAFRQAHMLGSHLVVGVNSSNSIAACKGFPPVLTDAERQAVVAACRFVDEIVPESPYIMTAEYIQELIETKHIDYFVHGDDPCIVDGKDVYEAAKEAGRYRSFPRTEGISTTDLVGRMLDLSKDHHEESPSASKQGMLLAASLLQEPVKPRRMSVNRSRFLVTSQLLQAFSAALPAQMRDRRREGMVTVYVDGAWDMFHAGHVDFLRKARELGREKAEKLQKERRQGQAQVEEIIGHRLLVGVHSDASANEHAGTNRPVMSMHERVLSVLGCRYVDDVLLDAPWEVTEEMITTLGLDIVARGTVHDCLGSSDMVAADPHAVPKLKEIHVELTSEVDLTIEAIAHRVQQRGEQMRARFQEKRRKEDDWYRQKHGLQSIP